MLNHNRAKATTRTSDTLTPTQSLVLEILGVRHRTGESLWNFDSRLTKQIDELEAIGLVTSMHGSVENTVRASLTDAGRAAATSTTYDSPIELELRVVKAELADLRRLRELGR